MYKSMHEFAIDIRKLKAAASVALSATSNTVSSGSRGEKLAGGKKLKLEPGRTFEQRGFGFHMFFSVLLFVF